MPTNYRDEDRIRLTEVERVILIALLKGNALVYELGRTMDADNREGTPYSSGTLYPALKRLCVTSMVEKLDPNSAKLSARSLYRITPMGSEALSWELMRLQDQINRAKDRIGR